jgi:type II secretory pathway pseudopilin PulG
MSKLSPKGTAGAFTLIEILIILATLILIAVFLIPGLVRDHRKAAVQACANNLKHVGLAFRTWDVDSGGNWPAKESTNAGGVKELVGTGHVYIHFRVMSNELSTPKVLVCPLDLTKTIAKDFGPKFNDSNVSYFVGTDAMETQPLIFLSGDRNLAYQGQPIKPGLFVLTTI